MQSNAAAWYVALPAFGNVLPDALLGIVVVRDAKRLAEAGGAPAQGRARRWVIGHLLVAVSAATKVGSNLSAVVLMHGSADLARYDPLIAGWQWFFSLTNFLVIHSLTRAHWTEAEALRARLDPHFLFNTLHSLSALVRARPEDAEPAIEQLGDLLRYILRSREDGRDEVLLSEEWAFTCNYLDPAALAAPRPALSLQPLVENAIHHAIAKQARGGRLVITARVARVEGHELVISVEDDGPGATAAEVARAGGLGFALVRRRLAAIHGVRGKLEIATVPGKGFRATLRVPIDGGSDEP
ncbi:MAG: hypothetical protein EXS13_06180 [Planctomycetes bacterium]|nr:hypothetical protein [Planctomycetota bacterium]